MQACWRTQYSGQSKKGARAAARGPRGKRSLAGGTRDMQHAQLRVGRGDLGACVSRVVQSFDVLVISCAEHSDQQNSFDHGHDGRNGQDVH